MTCLKFVSESEAQTLLPQFYADEGWVRASLTHALDPVGTLHAEDGTPIDGWHMNFQGELPEGCEAFVVVPINAKVVWG